jgi:hypothetical protein
VAVAIYRISETVSFTILFLTPSRRSCCLRLTHYLDVRLLALEDRQDN